MNGMLRLRVLGSLEVSRDGAVLPLPQSRKTRALLSYLALSGRSHSRDRLVSLFWDIPDDPRGALRWSLSKLRGVLDDDDRLRIRADRETVALDTTDIEIDLHTIRALVDAGLERVETGHLQSSVEAFDGDLLAGLDLPDSQEYQFWLVAQREEAAALKARLHGELVARFSGEPARAVPHARAILDFDPYDEEAHAVLIGLLKAAGRTQEAEDHYRRTLSDLEQGGETADRLRAAWSSAGRRVPAARPLEASSMPETAPSGGVPPAEEPPALATQSAQDNAGSDIGTAAPRAFLGRPAVAVLPFDDMTLEGERDFFADGITDDIITALSQCRLFPVIARASTRIYKGRHVQASVVGAELGARYIVQGSVRRSGNRVRVIAQLVNALTGLSIWAQQFNGEIEDIFDLQDEIARQIVTEIEPALARAEISRTENIEPRRLDTWSLRLRAIECMYKATPQDLDRAHDLLERALGLDAESSATHSLIALCGYLKALLIWKTTDPSGLASVYYDAARRSVELDDNNWLGHALLGMCVLWFLRDYAAAESEVQRAVDLNPSSALVHQFNGCIYIFAGQPAEAIPYLNMALRLNPVPISATLQLSDLALSHILLGDLDQAVSYSRRAISKYNGNGRAWERLAAALGLQGRIDEAEDSVRRMTEMCGAPERGYIEMTYPFRDPAHGEIFMKGLAAAGLKF